MQLLYKSATPSYQGCTPATTASPGLLSSLWCSLFGAAVPAYRTKNGNGVQASAPSRCFWQLSPTPAYKTAPAATNVDPSAAPDAASTDGNTCACDAVPTEIHVW
jgi:hypothetical protein